MMEYVVAVAAGLGCVTMCWYAGRAEQRARDTRLPIIADTYRSMRGFALVVAALLGALATLVAITADASMLVRISAGDAVTECRTVVEPLLYTSEPRLEIDCNTIFTGGFE